MVSPLPPHANNAVFAMDKSELRERHEANEEWMADHAEIVLGHGIAPPGTDIEDLRDEYESREDENRRIETYLDD